MPRSRDEVIGSQLTATPFTPQKLILGSKGNALFVWIARAIRLCAYPYREGSERIIRRVPHTAKPLDNTAQGRAAHWVTEIFHHHKPGKGFTSLICRTQLGFRAASGQPIPGCAARPWLRC